MEMQALIEEIASLAEKVKSGTATVGELEAFVSATQQLNERAIILRYKAYEAKVYGISTPDSAQSAGSSNSINYSQNDRDERSENKKITEEPAEMSAPASVEDSEDLSFDLFSMDDTSVPLSVHETESETVVEKAENQPAIEEPVLAIEEKEEEIIDEPAAAFTPEVKEEVPAPVAETPAQPETTYPETDIQLEPAAPVQPASTGNEHPVIQRALKNDGSLQSRLLSVRLETLKSAFGLNERMLIVRELFGGSNDAYNEAIEHLDNQPEIGPARSKVSALANQYGWNADNELAIEFVQKVERRYA